MQHYTNIHHQCTGVNHIQGFSHQHYINIHHQCTGVNHIQGFSQNKRQFLSSLIYQTHSLLNTQSKTGYKLKMLNKGQLKHFKKLNICIDI